MRNTDTDVISFGGKKGQGNLMNTAPPGVWLDFEQDDYDYGEKVNATENPEILSATSVDRLIGEKRMVEGAEQAARSLDSVIDFIADNEENDQLVQAFGAYPTNSTGGCCIIL